MEDPTTPDIISTPQLHEGGIQLQLGTGETFRRLQDDIQNGPLKNKPFSYIIMTMNMGGGKSTGKGTAENRRKLLSTIIENSTAHLIFVQEIKPLKSLNSLCKNRDYEYRRTGEEAGIMWNNLTFSGIEVDLKKQGIRDLVEKRNLEEEGEMLSRMSAVQLTAIGGNDTSEGDAYDTTQHSFLACSWHGPWIGKSIKEKQKALNEIQVFLKKLSLLRDNIPFVISGDFNLDTTDVSPLEGIALPRYEESPRSKNAAEEEKYVEFKDNFMFLSPKLDMCWLRPIEFLRNESKWTGGAGDLSSKQLK